MTEQLQTLQLGVLCLEDGMQFSGELFGASISAKHLEDSINKTQPAISSRLRQNEAVRSEAGYGEVVFNTSLTGYQEILSDPSYYGQIICMTAAHIGNTGINTEDEESAHPWCGGLVVREASLSHNPSHWRSETGLDAYLKKHSIPGLHGVDTRALTLHLRTQGVVRGIILPEKEKHLAPELLKRLPSFEGRDLIAEVSTVKPYLWQGEKIPVQEKAQRRYRVAVLDFGVKWNLLRLLTQRGCDLEVYPASTSAEEILARNPDGVFLSNGPGDPAAAPYAVETTQALLGKVPLFGVCMGHQILSLALGAKTYKLKFGHRGGNQPVLEHSSGHVEISSHNHGYAVEAGSLPKDVTVTHMNLNDKTVEGISCPKQLAFSVQYHPESSPGPHDSMVHFDRFIAMIRDHVSKVS